jgi:hypothetical protein
MVIILRDEYKFYHFRTPKWFIIEEMPGDWLSPGDVLVSLENIPGEVTYIYGYYIYASEESEFMLWWHNFDLRTYIDVERSIRISLPGPGTVMYANTIPINLDLPHNEGSFGLYILNQPSPGSTYKAGIFASGCRFSEGIPQW